MFVAVIAMFGAILLWWFLAGWWFEENKFLKLLPDSALSEPVLESPQGKAFLTRYPDSQTYVFQDFNNPDCCEVTLGYIQNKTETCISNEREYWCGARGPSATLRTQLNVSSDLKNITMPRMWLFCSAEAVGGQPDSWTVKGDIVESLRLENPDCWHVGPPPRPSDTELIEMARNTDVGKAYLAKYPDNRISIFLGLNEAQFPEPKVIFTPVVSEPIQYGVSFDHLDWYIMQIWIRCTNGDYYYAFDEDIWPYFQPEHQCLESVHGRIEAANKTSEVKEFLAKYPTAEALSGNPSTSDSNATVQYKHQGALNAGLAKEARLTVVFEGRSDTIVSFEVACYAPHYDGKKSINTDTGKSLDVTNFLQGSLCP
jgi:hypothetical protein